ncbi:hypothetical protein P3X46_010503, partial [Hevea brasiliensis]
MRYDPKKRDLNKYSRYHSINSHNTKNYHQLIIEVERLIKRGHLKNFIMKVDHLERS